LYSIPYYDISSVIKSYFTRAPVAQGYNPNYLGCRDQEDHVSKLAQANSSRDPISKKMHHTKIAGRVTQGIGPKFKPKYPPSPLKKYGGKGKESNRGG
jgi:hypothetical protein